MHAGKKFHCDLCDYAASTKVVLKFHRESKHDGIRYPCSECEFSGSDKSSLRRHTKRKHAVSSFSCMECGLSCSSRAMLQKHKKTAQHTARLNEEFQPVDPGTVYTQYIFNSGLLV